MSIWGSKQFYASSDIDLDVKIYVSTLQFRSLTSTGTVFIDSSQSLSSSSLIPQQSVTTTFFSSSSTPSTPLSSLPSTDSSLFDEAYIALQIIDGGIPLHPFARSTRLGVCDTTTSLGDLPERKKTATTTTTENISSPQSTSSSSSSLSTAAAAATITRLIWNEWITLPIKIKELPPTAQLIIRLWTTKNTCIGGGTLKLFTNQYVYQNGYVPITIWYTGIKESNMSNTMNTSSPPPNAPAATTMALPTPLALLLRSDHQLTTYIKALERYCIAANGGGGNNSNTTNDNSSSSLSFGTNGKTFGNNNTTSPWTDRLIFQQLQKEFQYSYYQNDQATIRTSSSSSLENYPVPLMDKSSNSNDPPITPTPTTTSAVSSPTNFVDTLILGYGSIFFPLFSHPILYEDTRYDGYDENITLNNSTNKKLLKNGTGNGSSVSNSSSSSGPNSSSSSSSSGTNILTSQQNHQLLTPPLTVTMSTTTLNAMNAIPSSDTTDSNDTMIDRTELALSALGRTYWSEQLAVIYDPEEGGDLDNPTDNKYLKLARGGLNAYTSNPYLKPNRVELTKLQTITNTPQDSYSILGVGKLLNPEARDLIWKFRYTLTANKKGAVPFILAIDWDDEEEIKEASLLLQKWVLIDIEDALRLLCPQFTSPIVRKFAVNALKAINDNDLGLFLLQLVQALRYEPSLSTSFISSSLTTSLNTSPDSVTNGTTLELNNNNKEESLSSNGGVSSTTTDTNSSLTYRLSPLADFLLERCSNNLELGMAFHWYLRVGAQDARAGALFTQVHEAFLESLPSTTTGQLVENSIRKHEHFITRVNSAVLEVMQPKREKVEVKIDRLNKLLMNGSPYEDIVELESPVTLPLNPHINISGIQLRTVHIFKSALYPTAITLRIHPNSRINWLVPNEICGVTIHETALKAAKEALQYATQQQQQNNAVSTSHPTAIANAGTTVIGPGTDSIISSSSSSSSIIGSSVTVSGALPSNSVGTTDKSFSLPQNNNSIAAVVAEAVKTAMPNGVAPATYKVIFKNGDDMRQDQLIIQMIRLLDAQLKRVGLDLCLTPYAVLATSMSSGVMEMVLNSSPVSAVVEKYRGNPIQAFFRENYPSSTSEFGIQSEIMDTYIKSCAGYCVITYLLGIGDRHLDNIMLTRDGHLFHLDFGYIFGKDPKPLPPPMRITKEMIDGMGGPDNPNYQRFRAYCCQAYNILRRSATLITVLLSLMRDAGIDDLHPEPMTTIAKLYEKFRVDIDDEAADSVFLRLVDDSVAAMFPVFFEMLHKIRVAMR